MKESGSVTGDELLRALGALANPHRLRIVAALAEGREYVSRLARRLETSRPLLHMHLQRLEAAGLVSGTLELSEEGKAMKYYEVTEFALELTLASVAIWQVFGTGRTAIASKGEGEYRSLAEEATAAQAKTAAALERLTTEVGELRERTEELEKLLKEVG
jgi:ArsR family transcriptional regulator